MTETCAMIDKVKRALQETGYSTLSALCVSLDDGVITLRGKVSTYHLKQLAQSVTLAVPGVEKFCNDIQVVSPT